MGTGASIEKAAEPTSTPQQFFPRELSVNVSMQPSGNTFMISAASSEILGDVMRRYNFPNDVMRQVKIYFAGQQLQVDQTKTLGEFGIADGSTIMLVIVVCNRHSYVN